MKYKISNTDMPEVLDIEVKSRRIERVAEHFSYGRDVQLQHSFTLHVDKHTTENDYVCFEIQKNKLGGMLKRLDNLRNKMFEEDIQVLKEEEEYEQKLEMGELHRSYQEHSEDQSVENSEPSEKRNVLTREEFEKLAEELETDRFVQKILKLPILLDQHVWSIHQDQNYVGYYYWVVYKLAKDDPEDLKPFFDSASIRSLMTENNRNTKWKMYPVYKDKDDKYVCTFFADLKNAKEFIYKLSYYLVSVKF